MATFNRFGEHLANAGRKRHAEDEFEVQSGISTHFKKLRLNHAPTRVYTVDPRHATAQPAEEYMPVDETRDRIVIHDLAAEIAQIEAEEPQTLYLADIDRKVSAIPQKLLENRNPDPNTQLVLYRDPTSLSVPEEEDAVRRTVIAARERLREKHAREMQEHETNQSDGMNLQANHGHVKEDMDDPDAMEIE